MKRSTKLRNDKKALERKRIIGHFLFDDHFFSMPLEDFLVRLRRNQGVVHQQILYYHKTDPKWCSFDQEIYPDYKNIHSTLSYISDRCHDFNRLRWILGLLEVDINKVSG